MKPRVVVVGSSNTDLILRLDQIPRPGETRLGGTYFSAPGGKGANQAVAAARAGGRVTFVTRLGRDALGDAALAAFQRDRLDVRFVRRDRRAPSGVALIFVSRKGENSIGVAPGANAALSPADVRRAARAIAEADALLVQLEIPRPAVETAVTLAARAGTPVLLNPAPAAPLSPPLLRQVGILTPNESEAAQLSGVEVRTARDAVRAAQILRRQGAKTVIVTRGARGAVVVSDAGVTRVPAFRVRPVDTTAAGDVFNGALAVALGGGRALPDAVRFAAAAAALSVTRPGAQPSVPRRAAIHRLLAAPPPPAAPGTTGRAGRT